MTVFLCAKCSRELTPQLTALPSVPEISYGWEPEVLPSTVRHGHYAIETEPWGAPFVKRHGLKDAVPCHPRGPIWFEKDYYFVSAGPRNTVVIDPADAPSLEYLPGNRNCVGCCGPGGKHGLNQACPCGTPVATLAADCGGPHELHLDPLRVVPLD